MKRFSFKKQSGFVILFAVLISTIILLVGAGIFRISVKERVLASTARESTLAFFTADSMIECALYHDVKLNAFPRGGGNPAVPELECDNFANAIPQPSPFDVYEFRLIFNSVIDERKTPFCGLLQVDKSDPAETVIIARGYNICDGTIPFLNSPLLLERVLRVRYPG